MLDNISIIKKSISIYNDSKIAFIKKLIDNNDSIYDESCYIDDGIITAMIERLKKEYSLISDEFEVVYKHDNENKDKLNYLFNSQQEIKVQIAFWASNNINNLDNSLNMLEGVKTDFKLCLLGLMAYRNGKIDEALRYFSNYYNDRSNLLDHYLINKVYGTILFQIKKYEQSKLFLQKAVDKMPEDIEIHSMLMSIYKKMGMNIEEQIELSIINLLRE